MEFYAGSMPVEVFFAMSEEQAKKEHTSVCIYPAFPYSKKVYSRMADVPDSLCIEKKIGWERNLCVLRKDLPEVMKYLYPEDDKLLWDVMKILCPPNGQWEYSAIVNQVEGDRIWIIGFDD